MELIEKTVGEVFADCVRAHPDREFVIYADRNLRFTYAEFRERVDNLARGLLAIGMKKGDHLGVWATNVPDWLTFLFATAEIGVVLVTVNTNYRTHELEYLIEQSDITTLCLVDGFRDNDYIAMVNELIPELKDCARGRLKSARFPFLKNVVYIGQQKHRGMFSVPELLLVGQQMGDEELAEAHKTLDRHDVINMQYTSGTTGFPKGVMLTHRNILNNGFSIGECQRFTGAERVCLPVPYFHCFGLVLGIMAILTHGATIVGVETFDPLVVLASIQKERCTAVYGVPTMFIMELNHPMFSMFDTSSLRTGIMAGSPCPAEVMKEVMEKMHCRDITIAYGLTESSPVMTQTRTDDPIEVRVNTVGSALPAIEVSIRDPETNLECALNVQGEICCRGYNSMKGYYKMPEMTAKIIDSEGWLHSGDLGEKDANGNYRVTGRIKDMIIRGGENVYPREIEEFLYGMSGVQDVQVVGVPSAKYGEEVGAFIIPREGVFLAEEAVNDFCHGRISRHKIPKYIFIVKEFPMTVSGKIQKYRLREMSLELLKERGIEPS
ncbi:MAG: AMP-binding protein [Spirochaetota bacterium]|jgi:fatty-acyl-CoA synthase|nr:AMP-binding protein [Spirochaetota bacterium]